MDEASGADAAIRLYIEIVYGETVKTDGDVLKGSILKELQLRFRFTFKFLFR